MCVARGRLQGKHKQNNKDDVQARKNILLYQNEVVSGWISTGYESVLSGANLNVCTIFHQDSTSLSEEQLLAIQLKFG